MSTGAIGGGVQLGTGLLGSFINAKGAVHGSETAAQGGEAAIGTEQNATTAAIQADAYATAPERNVGTAALYELASLLGIDPAQAMGAAGAGSGTAGYGASGAVGPGGAGIDSSMMFSKFGGFDRDPIGLFKNYTQNPATFGSPQFYMGGQPSAQGYGPGTPGFGSLTKQFTMADFFANVDPAYNFRLEQGMTGIENSAAARGMQLSGSNLKDLDIFSQGLASEEYQNAFNRYQTQQNNEFNRLADLAGAGASASQSLGAKASELIGGPNGAGNNIASLQTSIGNVLARGQVGASNAIAGGIVQSGKDVNSIMGGLPTNLGGGTSATAPTAGGG